ncbi:hypothetical protein H4Q32_019991 [Labeo rohita]|uniref:Uncharacterized protein n=1 Tax=Labeo rohita TaxID=84645 RepID=A0ABQ8LDT3_LABRO|nr:hypothetical protein H4Q32_019991 [Labeo rohita]
MKVLGLRLNAKKSVLSPLQRTTYLGVVWDLTTMQAHLSPARIESILTAAVRVRKGRSLTVKQFQLLGLMAAVSNVIPFGLLYTRPLQWWLRTNGSPQGETHFTHQGHAVRWMRPSLVGERSWTATLPMVCGVTAVSLGISLPGDAGRVSGSETLPPRPKRPPCAGAHRQHSGGLLHQPPGRSASRPLYKLAHQNLVWSQDKLLSLRAVHIPGHLNLEADILPRQGPRPGEWMLHPEVLKQIWRAFCQAQVDLFVRVRHRNVPSGAGCHGIDVVEASSVCLSPIALLPGVLERVCHFFPRRSFGSCGCAPEGAHLIASGLSTEVVETILQSRAPSSRKLYALKWKPFTSWCGDRQQDSVNCPVGTVLGFLQDRFSTGLAHSTLKVYVAAISAYHAPLGGSSVGRNPLVTRFLRGALRPRPLARCSFAKCGRDAIS